MLEFGQAHVVKRKKNKKKRLYCKICDERVEEDEMLIHFGDKHVPEFEKWKLERGEVKQ